MLSVMIPIFTTGNEWEGFMSLKGIILLIVQKNFPKSIPMQQINQWRNKNEGNAIKWDRGFKA